jgi:hypothetical protein
VITACVISIALTLACAVPLIWVDKAWTRFLSRVTKPFLKKSGAAPRHASEKILASARVQAMTPAHPPGPTCYL